jgi:hypothetical protein
VTLKSDGVEHKLKIQELQDELDAVQADWSDLTQRLLKVVSHTKSFKIRFAKVNSRTISSTYSIVKDKLTDLWGSQLFKKTPLVTLKSDGVEHKLEIQDFQDELDAVQADW